MTNLISVTLAVVVDDDDDDTDDIILLFLPNFKVRWTQHPY